MAVMCTTMAVILCLLLGIVYPLRRVRVKILLNFKAWVYSKKGISVEILLNIIIVAVTVVLLLLTVGEKPDFPVRVWLVGYAVQCLVHVVLVMFEYRRRRKELDLEAAGYGGATGVVVYSRTWSWRCVDSWISLCDYLNLLASFVWVYVGVHWVPSPSQDKQLWQNAPRLYRLATIYLTYDIMFSMLILVGMVVCLSSSCICAIAIAYSGAGQKQKGSSKANPDELLKYRSRMSSNGEKPSVGTGVVVPMGTISNLLPTGAECNICEGSYDDGIELHVLPCNHHFHATCMDGWLKLSAKCPVCNYNVLKGSA